LIVVCYVQNSHKVTKINAYAQGVHAKIYEVQNFRCRNLRSAKFFGRHTQCPSIFTHHVRQFLHIVSVNFYTQGSSNTGGKRFGRSVNVH